MGRCMRCGGEAVRKSRSRLVSVGIALLAAAGLSFIWWPLWAPAVVCALTGAYLLAWASVSRRRGWPGLTLVAAVGPDRGMRVDGSAPAGLGARQLGALVSRL